MAKFALRTLLICWPVASFILTVTEIFFDRAQQWDLRNYLNGLRAFREGFNPYVDAIFIYPPVYLPILNAITTPFTHAHLHAGLVLSKAVGFVFLVYLWRRDLCPRLPWHVVLPVTWLGFYASFAVDFYAGNISTFEALALTSAFACFARGHFYRTAALVALASTPKLMPIVFLLALLTQPGGLRPFAVGVGAFAFYLGFNYGLYPEFAREFVVQAWSRTGEARLINPSSLALIKDALPDRFTRLATPLWVSFALGVWSISWRAWRSRPGRSRLTTILFLALVYVVSAPRMKDYAYLIALPSVLWALQVRRARLPAWLLAGPLVLQSKASAPLLFESAFALFWNYYPLMVAIGAWVLVLRELGRPRDDNLIVATPVPC